ncbi:hypothetical protein [Gimesia sp.]|uniref:hypothetical protein n=1 Tax=Gimesia sp. TaxID=2024833 RepID=UPI003A90A561
MKPGRHGVLANGVLVRGGIGVPVKIDSHRDQSDLVKVPTVVDVAHAAGLRTAEVNWPWEKSSPFGNETQGIIVVRNGSFKLGHRFRDELAVGRSRTTHGQAIKSVQPGFTSFSQPHAARSFSIIL